MGLIQVAPTIVLPDRALKFGVATSDRVDFGTCGAINPTSFSILCWFKPTLASTAFRVIVSKFISPGGWFIRITAAGIQILWQSTIGGNYIAYTANPLYDIHGQWICSLVVVDSAGGAAQRAKIYFGTLTSPLSEGVYTQQSDGAGTHGDPSSVSLMVGNRQDVTNLAFEGLISATMYIENRLLNQNEGQQWQNNPRNLQSAKMFSLIGDNGASTQWDLSGNANNGTVTGATQESGPAKGHSSFIDTSFL